MQPRILLRTHYQADEPRLIIAILTENCSSMTESRNEETIAGALERWAKDKGYTISTPAAIYAVDNARHLGLLDKSNRWTAAGLALTFLNQLIPVPVGMESRSLTSAEERIYLRLYLYGDGARVVKFAKWLVERGSTTDEQLRKESIFEQLSVQALEDYLNLATQVRQRTAIRMEKDRLVRTEYAASTKRHKRYPFLTTMQRLRLLQKEEKKDGSEIYRPDAEGRLEAFYRAVPSIDTLERLIRSDRLQAVLDLEMHEYERTDLAATAAPYSRLLEAYTYAMGRGIQACPLSYLNDVLRVLFPESPNEPSPNAEVLLQPIHQENPGDVRFHVDRRGQRAFVLLTARAIDRLKKNVQH